MRTSLSDRWVNEYRHHDVDLVRQKLKEDGEKVNTKIIEILYNIEEPTMSVCLFI